MVNVTMFQKVVDTFKIKARDKKYLVREFNYDEQAIAKDNEQIKTLEQNKKDKFVRFIDPSAFFALFFVF